MYQSYYQLSTKPFQLDADPRFLWLGEDHKEALAVLKYGLLAASGFVMLVGSPGTGKTTLVNALKQTLDDRTIVAEVNFTCLDPTAFLSLVARTFDPAARVVGKADSLLLLKDLLEHARADGKRALLVIDEAHRLPRMLLEEIRLLSNMTHNGEGLLNIFFVGQAGLKRQLRSRHCRALRQRITLFHHLRPLSEDATRQYIAHRLDVAGRQTPIFTRQAMRDIFKFTKGYPRRINKLCDRALLTGYVKDLPVIDAPIVIESAREISLIDPVAIAIPRLLRLTRAFWRQFKNKAASLRPRLRLAPAFKRRWTATAAWSATFWNTAMNRVRAMYQTTCAFNREKPRQRLTMTGALVATLLACALFAAGLFQYFDGGRPPQPDENHSLGLEETYIPTSYSTSAESPAASMPTDPSIESKVDALLAQNDYLGVIRLLEAADHPSAPRGSPLAEIYIRALLGRAAQLKEQSPEEAGTLLRKAVQTAPENLEALTALGNHYTRTRGYSLAIDTYQKVIELDPDKADVLFNLGFIFATTGMYASSELALTRVVQLNPDFVDKALFNLAVVQHKLGKHRESLAALEKVVAIRPDNQEARAFLAELKAAGQDRP